MFKLREYIDTLDLDVDQTYRGNCPVCHGDNTFTATRDHTNVKYNCYKNSCGIGGSQRRQLNASDIMSLQGRINACESYSQWELSPFEAPPYLVPYEQAEYPVDPTFLDRYDIDPTDVMYDVRQDRVVFPVYTESAVLVDAVGRSMTGRTPKWLRYASSPMPYVHGSGEVAVIVEDAISAYVIGEWKEREVVGIALLGTQLTDFHRRYITKWFDKLIVALDPDALDKTIKIARELNCKALNLKDDLKYREPEDLDKLAEMLYA